MVSAKDLAAITTARRVTQMDEHDDIIENGEAQQSNESVSFGGREEHERPRRRRAILTAGGLAAVVAVSAATAGVVVHNVDTPKTSATSATATAPAVATSSVTSVLAKIEPSVVEINTVIEASGFGGESEEEDGAGTGVIINTDGEILTNNHVIADASTITVTLSDGTKRTAIVVNANSSKDLAVIKISGATGLVAATFANSASVAVGDSVIAIGNAEGYGGSPTVTEGIISATNRSLDGTESLSGLLQTDAALNPGNSGGPLVDSAGDVIGVDVAIATGTTDEPAQNIGFAITSATVESYLAGLTS
jgi:S1-C subfamily serine protease